jgi:hypothetical protein
MGKRVEGRGFRVEEKEKEGFQHPESFFFRYAAFLLCYLLLSYSSPLPSTLYPLLPLCFCAG